jgi:RNA polymerase sigma-70 factor (ECF subfamily)
LPGRVVKPGVTDPTDAAFRRHRAQVFRYLRRRTESDEVAEDLTQEVFLAAARHLARLDTERPLLAWLYRVARSRLLDEARRTRRRPQTLALEAVPEPAETDYPRQLAHALHRAGRRLSEPERQVIGLRLFGDRSFADVAALLGISEAAAKMRYLRAVRALRAELEKEGITP